MFKQRVQQFINEKKLLDTYGKVLVALSGGADSVALLRVLLSSGYSCECAHCNFHLRGEESDKDELFVQHLCDRMGSKLHLAHFDTRSYASANKLSIEMAARELRYAWFEELRAQVGANAIAVAHHRDDSVETILLNLIRGTGINGLKGIAPRNGYIVRPLLQESRESIEEYLRTLEQDYVIDSTNLQDVYMRNKIRLNILPMMKELNPSVAESIQETGVRLAEVARIYNRDRKEVLNRVLKEISADERQLCIVDVLQDVAPESLLYEALSPLGFNAAQVKDILHCIIAEQSGKRFHSLQWEVLRDRDSLLIHRRGVEDEALELLVDEQEITSGFMVPKDRFIACVDADKIIQPLTLRKCRVGDWFVPFGMKGRKKVSDYLTDRKRSLYEKERQWVVCSGEDIVWLVDERIDNRFRVKEDSRRVLLISIKKKKVDV